MTTDILIVDDEQDIRSLIRGILEDEGYAVREAENSQQTLEQLDKRLPDLMILDIWLHNSEYDGLDILKNVKGDNPFLPVIMISGHGTIETAVTAIKQGAYDFIEKPFKADRLILMIERALENADLKRENAALREQNKVFIDLVGQSGQMNALKQVLEKIAPTNSRVVLTGEAGSGKEIAARYIHAHSRRAEKPFITLNCANMHPDRLEQELFGVEHPQDGDGPASGLLEQADGGTLLLDEITDMPVETQAKILHVLQDQEFTRLGGHSPVRVDVRIMASSNRNLQQAVADHVLRQDLYYRLCVVPVEIPPLRERYKDIKALTEHFMQLYSAQSGLPVPELSDGALTTLQAYSWPGNVRQLRNMVEWIMIMGSHTQDRLIRAEHLPAELNETDESEDAAGLEARLMNLPLREAREKFEREYLLSQIERFEWNISKTAKFIGMERSALHRKLKSLNVMQNGNSPEDQASVGETQAEGKAGASPGIANQKQVQA